MIDVLNTPAARALSPAPRYPLSRLLLNAAELLLHPVITLPVIVYLLGGSAGQTVIYAIIAGVAMALTGPAGTLVAMLPQRTRVVMAILLGLQGLGLLLALLVAIGVDTFANGTLLRMAAIAYLLILVPAEMLARIAEQGYEYRQAAASSVRGVLPALVGSLLAGLLVWRLFDAGGIGPDDLLARTLVPGALLAGSAAWLASLPTILADHLPHPARPMPTVRSPRVLSNEPLWRYMAFQAIRGLARFADPLLLVGVLTLISPGIVWVGGAVLAFAVGEAIARLIATNAYEGFNVRVIFTISGFLHAIAVIVIAFAADVFGSSVVAEREPSAAWKHWAVIVAATALGASYLFARTGHHAYVRSISSPHTRDLTQTSVGAVFLVTAFSPLIAVALLERQDLATLLQIGAGASIISLLATAMIVPTYARPRRPRGAWGLRR